jgi:uncharacterized membrane protein YoaK (UPF0700 family)
MAAAVFAADRTIWVSGRIFAGAPSLDFWSVIPIGAWASKLRDPQRLPVILSIVAGYVDSCTFLGIFGLFVAQVTGSFVQTGTAFVAHDPGMLIRILAIPFFFFGCAMAAVAVAVARDRGHSAQAWSFGLEALFLACFLIVAVAASPLKPDGAGEFASAFFGLAAMGVQSAQVRLLMKGVNSTNVMTTTTTLIAIEAVETIVAWRRQRQGEDNAAASAGASRKQVLQLISIAAGFLAGTIIGGLAFSVAQFWSLLLPTATMLGLAVSTARAKENETAP